MHAFRHRQEGFSLVEVMAAIVVFTIVTLGIVPLIGATLRGSNLSRAATVGKNVAVETMERLRGLPLHISYGTEPTKVDVLDLFFPQAAGVEGDGVTYRVECPGAGVPACNIDLPDGYSVVVESQFVERQGSAPETYDAVPPPAGYSWDSENTDEPPEDLLRVVVTAVWKVGDTDREYSLTSLMTNRPFGDQEGQSQANVTYAVQARTAVRSGTDVGFVEATAGHDVVSRIALRRVPRASQTSTSAQLSLEDSTGAPLVECSGECLVTGAAGSESAPGAAAPVIPGKGPLSIAAAGSPYEDVAGTTSTGAAVSAAASGFPEANGSYDFIGGLDQFWVDQPTRSAVLQVDADQPVFLTAGVSGLGGETEARSDDNDISSGSSIDIEEIRFFPTTWINSVDSVYGGAVLVIEDFTMTVSCAAFLSTTGSPAGEIEYSGTIRYWQDTLDTGTVAGGSYSAALPFDQDSNVLGTIRNALVYDSPVDNSGDVYLFAIPDHGHRNTDPKKHLQGGPAASTSCPSSTGHCGYFANMSNFVPTATTIVEEEPGSDIAADGVGQRARVDVSSGVLQVRTHSITNPERTAAPAGTAVSPVSVSVGGLSCLAEDMR